MATVLFVCLHNAGRSQMSQALFERAAAGRHTALSAGTTPGRARPPRGRGGYARARHRPVRPAPQLSHAELAEQADVVVTMGCGDACPYIPGKRYIDWDLPDPKGRPISEVRAPAMTSRAASMSCSPTYLEGRCPLPMAPHGNH